MFIWPVPGPITRGFDYKSWLYVGGQHAAIDIAAPSNTPIKAIADGRVAERNWDALSGFFVAVDHGDWRSVYRHLQGHGRATGDVRQGHFIGYVGNTGLSEGPHLHFDLWSATKHDPTAFAKHGLWAHNPELYLGEEDMALQQVVEEHQGILENHSGQIKQLKEAEKSYIEHIARFQQQIAALERRAAAGGLKRGDTVKLA